MTVTLVGVAHGTRSAEGPVVVRALLDRVRAQRPEIPVVEAYVELVAPVLGDALSGLDGPVVVVPLLLSRGYHVGHDLPDALAASGVRGVVAPPLGPDPDLAALLDARLDTAGASRDQAVVLTAAGSSDPDGVADVRTVADLLAARRRTPVEVGFVSSAVPRVADVLREGVAVAPYLLAPGTFVTAIRERAAAVGAGPVAEVLGADDRLAALVWRRYDAALPLLPQR